jgi:hypothetical protein
MLGLAQSNVCSIRWRMATKDQLLYSTLHGTAMRYAAERRWYASPATHVGYEPVGAGMLIMAAGHDGKPLDYPELQRWTRVGL